MSSPMNKHLAVAAVLASLLPLTSIAQTATPAPSPGGAVLGRELWKVNDRGRPRPPKAELKSEAELAESAKAPEGAVILFDGKDLSQWQPSKWKVADGVVEIVPHSGYLYSKESFGSCKLHLEWRTQNPPVGKDQGQGNSGVYMMTLYEMQILDNTNNPTYADGMAGAVYGENPPWFDACRPSGEWNYYDITWHRPIFDADGKVVKRARVTLIFNGVKVQDEFELTGPTGPGHRLPYKAHADKMPIGLQEHHCVDQFRNIWVVPIAD